MAEIRESISIDLKMLCAILRYEYFGIEDEDSEDNNEDNEQDIYEEVDRITNYTDLEKEYKDLDIILKRKSDEKFFKVGYFDGTLSVQDLNKFPLKGKEVFPKQITTTIYE